ncbi:ATP-binding protein [Bacteroides sp. 51]|uniref:ATP-binding protein n=1 Tax=Bacteroides sp. 51 TaxID=2302938 RepID=UPI0013D5881F|nr:AAA family ATPase [Bacteroides sp. 51]NDV82952.1 ATP-binding protein [Bacteroides sp. 51]
MEKRVQWFNEVLTVAIQIYFRQECSYTSIYEIPVPETEWLDRLPQQPSFDEAVVLMLALMPHLSPQVLDIFFVHNKNFDRPYTEFGGWKGMSHGGFLPTGETAAFILAGDHIEKRKEVIRMFQADHWFYIHNVLRLEGHSDGEPFLSAQLRVSEEVLHRLLLDREYKPDYSIGFPAKRITSPLDWEDMVLDYQTARQLEEINNWINHHATIMEEWGLKRILKAGYRALFYGPPGTGKTLAATLLGKRNEMDVYRIDLSMVVSKYIGETEKNLARVFDLAENRNWILFFDEADALFGKRTSTQTSNDRHANQEVAYLLQRIEDFPGTVILATNLRSNIDEAFSRRFQSLVYFAMPSEDIRRELWEMMLPTNWGIENRNELIDKIASYELAGGAMTNVIRSCALQMVSGSNLDERMIVAAIKEELLKNQSS